MTKEEAIRKWETLLGPKGRFAVQLALLDEKVWVSLLRLTHTGWGGNPAAKARRGQNDYLCIYPLSVEDQLLCLDKVYAGTINISQMKALAETMKKTYAMAAHRERTIAKVLRVAATQFRCAETITEKNYAQEFPTLFDETFVLAYSQSFLPAHSKRKTSETYASTLKLFEAQVEKTVKTRLASKSTSRSSTSGLQVCLCCFLKVI
jgi:hypothetical protein